MQELPIKRFFCQNEIACRFLNSPLVNEPLILAIPGGPYLSGKYLDGFLFKVAEQLNINVGIIDLPNHGDSQAAPTKLPLSYQDCIDSIDNALIEISEQCGDLILFGQSFGARVAYDLLEHSRINITGLFLTGFPYQFDLSEGMKKKIGLLDMQPDQNNENSEQSFLKVWQQLLPLYTYAPLAGEMVDLLSLDIKVNGNEGILDDVSSIKKFSDVTVSYAKPPLVMIVQGDADGVVPDNNLLMLNDFIPSAFVYEIKNCGHFPMIENHKETLIAFSQFMALIRG